MVIHDLNDYGVPCHFFVKLPWVSNDFKMRLFHILRQEQLGHVKSFEKNRRKFPIFPIGPMGHLTVHLWATQIPAVSENVASPTDREKQNVFPSYKLFFKSYQVVYPLQTTGIFLAVVCINLAIANLPFNPMKSESLLVKSPFSPLVSLALQSGA